MRSGRSRDGECPDYAVCIWGLGFWKQLGQINNLAVSDARTDFAMLCSLLFLILLGGGAWSADSRLMSENHAERRTQ